MSLIVIAIVLLLIIYPVKMLTVLGIVQIFAKTSGVEGITYNSSMKGKTTIGYSKQIKLWQSIVNEIVREGSFHILCP